MDASYYKGIKCKAKPHPLNSERKKSPLTGIADIDINQGIFFPQTIRDWNALSESVISSAEVADDCVATFTFSLLRARD